MSFLVIDRQGNKQLYMNTDGAPLEQWMARFEEEKAEVVYEISVLTVRQRRLGPAEYVQKEGKWPKL